MVSLMWSRRLRSVLYVSSNAPLQVLQDKERYKKRGESTTRTGLPKLRKLPRLLSLIRQVLLQLLLPLLTEHIQLVLQALKLDLNRHHLPLQLLQLIGFGFLGEAEGGRSFVDEVNGFIGKEAIGDVARSVNGGWDSFVISIWCGSIQEGWRGGGKSVPVTKAPSDISTPWWTSYRGLRPRRIEMVDSTVGSSIETGWKRRSSAASLPIVFRYSSAVGVS